MLDTRFFPSDFRGKYPHMFPGDVAVWEKFLDQEGKNYQGFYYDVMVGEEALRYPHWEENYAGDAKILSKLRIDAVGLKDNEIHLIEVKPCANMAAVGQLLTYKEHYLREYPTRYQTFMLLVCEQIDPNILPVVELQGIIIYQV